MYSFGGPGCVTVQILANCLSRMANWIRLTISAVSAEFPNWQVLMSLDVLDLKRHCQGTVTDRNFTPTTQNECFARLAKYFSLDEKKFREEYDSCLPIAVRNYLRDGSGMSVPAWIIAVSRMTASRCYYLQRNGGTRLEISAVSAESPLARVVLVAQCWVGLSTSPIEQAFSKIKAVVGKESRMNRGPDSENIEARLCCDLSGASQEFRNIVFDNATNIWCRFWSKPRASGPIKRHGNFRICPKRNDSELTEKGFLKKRRIATAQGTTSAASAGRSTFEILQAAVSAGESTWNHHLTTKEKQLQNKTLMSKYSGEHTILETLDQVVLDEVRKKQKNACKVAETKKTKQLQTAQLFKSKKNDMRGMTVYLGSVSTKRAQCRCWIRQNGMREAAASAAAVFVDDNPAAPGSRCSQLAAGLLGGMLDVDRMVLVCV